MSERQTKAGNQITLSHSLIRSLSHYFTLSFTHSRHAEQLLFSRLCPKIRSKTYKIFLEASSDHPTYSGQNIFMSLLHVLEHFKHF